MTEELGQLKRAMDVAYGKYMYEETRERGWNAQLVLSLRGDYFEKKKAYEAMAQQLGVESD